jgi:cyclase
MFRALILCLLLVPALLIAQEQQPELKVTQLSESLHMIEGGGGNVVVSVGNDGIYLIDDQLEPFTDQLLETLKGISDSPVRFIINTHYHGDHVGGNEAIGKGGAVIISHDNIRKRMSVEQFSIFLDSTTPPFPSDALPVITFNDRLTLHLNGEVAEAIHLPHGHTDGDSMIHFPDSNVIHISDQWFNGLYPYVDLDGGGTIQGMINGVDVALALADDETKIVPGHGPLGDKTGLQAYRDFLAKAVANVQELIDKGFSLEAAIEAKPTAQWDEDLGNIWIKPHQFVTFIYNSLKGIDHFTPQKSD